MLLSIKQYTESLVDWRFFPALFIILLTTFSLIVTPGYESFTSDQAIFLPPLLHNLDPSFFPNTDLQHSHLIHSERSVILDILAFFVRRGTNLLLTLFILSALLRALLFALLYALILYFTENRLRASFILLFFLTPFFIPGTGHVTIENMFTYRTIAVPAGLLYLVLYLHGKRFVSLIPLLLTFSVHAITALPFFCFHFLHLLHTGWHKRMDRLEILRNLLLGITLIIGMILFLVWRSSGATNAFFLHMDEEWKQLANPRNAPAFYAYWDSNSYFSIISWLILGSIPLLYMKEFLRKAEKRAIFLIILLVPIVMGLLAAIGELSSLHGIIKLNLQRGILFISLFIPLLVSMLTLWHAEQKREEILKNTFLISILAWFLFKENFVFLREQMLLFVPPTALLFYGLPRAALAVFAATDAAVIYRSLFYGDVFSIISFHLALIAGWMLSELYANSTVSSSSLARHGVIAAIPILVIMILFSLNSFTIYPAYSYNTPYMESCAWIQQHTHKSNIFIVEPFVTDPPPADFRLACLRPIFTTYKEGGVVPYDENRAVGFEWKKRYDLIYALKNDITLIGQIKQAYQVDYIFSQTPLALPQRYPLVFSNEAYFIYDIRN